MNHSENAAVGAPHTALHQHTAALCPPKSDHADVALVNMPFGSAARPSIQCGLLKAGLAANGYDADVHYLNLELAACLGPQLYKALSQLRANMLIGEWLFGAAAFGPSLSSEHDDEYFPRLTEFCEEIGVSAEDLKALRSDWLPRWIQHWAQAIDWRSYSIIGFTSTFEQNNASFALARQIKISAPGACIVFGGANFDGEMGAEYVRALPFIDYAVVGEGDVVFPELVRRILQKQDATDLRGIVALRDNGVVGNGPAPLVHNLDSLPDPDYTEYFGTLNRLSHRSVLGDDGRTFLLIESSRGCWWGQKHHCTFCGLNAESMRYRSKSASATWQQMSRLAQRHRATNFEAVDNILDYRYITDLCDLVRSSRSDFRLFYEVKANLKREQLRAMAQGGIRSIQPGIESLNSHILVLMRKGTTMLQNVRCLKWALYYGVEVAWNILTGFPGETIEDYEQQQSLLPLIAHLQPPNNCGRIWLERFSPYFADSTFPLRNVRPLRAYHAVYPGDQIAIDKVAYFFDYEMDETVSPESYDRLSELVSQWKRQWRSSSRPQLFYQRAPDWLRIVDRRRTEEQATELGRVQALIYEACVEAERTPAQIQANLVTAGMAHVDINEISLTLQNFCDLGLAISENDKFLALALPMNRNW